MSCRAGKVTRAVHGCECERCGASVLHGIAEMVKDVYDEVRLDQSTIITDTVIEEALHAIGHRTFGVSRLPYPNAWWRIVVPGMTYHQFSPVLAEHKCMGAQ